MNLSKSSLVFPNHDHVPAAKPERIHGLAYATLPQTVVYWRRPLTATKFALSSHLVSNPDLITDR